MQLTGENPHQVDYADSDTLQSVLGELRSLPGLVTPIENGRLTELLDLAARGEYFVLHAGDCAERFSDSTIDIVTAKLEVLLRCGQMLSEALKKPVVYIGRLAGQYAKPRTSPTETLHGETLLSFRGEIIHDPIFSETARNPVPGRMKRAYECSKQTLAFVREFMTKSMGGKQPEFFISHEALHLPYEACFTRLDVKTGKLHNVSTHFPWVGMRTAFPGTPQVDYASRIANPLAIKIGPALSIDALLHLLNQLNPENSPGRITLIHRLGCSDIEARLPALIRAVQQHRRAVTWLCDPMHGNTKLLPSGMKTRYVEDVYSEIVSAVAIHRRHQNILSGVHLEMTSEAVTECVGGECGITEQDLGRCYRSLVDPRLNGSQVIEVIRRVAEQWEI